jgi:hypothetical protein
MLLAGTIANLTNTFDYTIFKRVVLDLTKALAVIAKMNIFGCLQSPNISH